MLPALSRNGSNTARWANRVYRIPTAWSLPRSLGFAVLVTGAAALLIRLLGAADPVAPALLLFTTAVLTARVAGFGPSLLSVALGAAALRVLLPAWSPLIHLVTFGVVSVVCCAVTASLRTARIHLARVLDSISDAFGVIDRSWRIQFINRRAEELIRRAAREVEGRHLFDVFPALARTPLLANLERAHAQQRPLHVEGFDAELDLWFEATLVVTPEGILAFARDITGRKKDEERLRQSLEVASRANEELQYFARAVSHDYVQPLSTISSYAELIRADANGSTRQYAGKIVEMIGKASALLRLYSDFSRSDADPLVTTTPLGQALERARTDLGDTLRRSQVEVVAGELPSVRAHSELLHLFFRHTLALVLSARHAPSMTVAIGAQRDGDEWMVHVVPRYGGGAAEPRSATDESLARGRLAICRGIIERHGGRFWTETDDHGVMTVRFTFPATP